MADESREVTITIRGKNLTQAEFAAARKDLAGVDDQAKKTSLAASGLGTAMKALGGAFAIGSITSAISSYADLTGELTDMSAKTGIGVEALQRLKYAAEQNGGSLEQVTGAISKLGANLAGGNKSAVGALDALGLSFNEIRSMSPDKAFTTIADSIAKIPDPMAQSKLAMDLFGKSGADLLPMMKGNLSETAEAADRLGIVLSEEAVRAGDEFGDTMGTLAAVGKSVIAQVLEPMIPVLTTVAKWMGETLPGAIRFVTDALSIGLGRAFMDVKIWFNEFLLSIAEGVNKIPLLGEKIGFSAETIAGLRSNVTDAKGALALFTDQTVATSSTQVTAAKTIGALNLNYEENEKKTTKAASALQKSHKFLEDWNDEVDKQNLTISKGMATMADFTKAIELHTDRVSKGIISNALARKTYENELDGLVRERTMTRLNLEIEAVGRWAANEKLLLDKSVANWQATADAIDKVAEKKIAILDEDGLLAQRIIFANLETDAKRAVSNVGAAFKDIGNTILGAIQGGGSVIQAVGSSLGQGLAKDFVKKFGTKITGALGDTIGGAVNAMLPGLGALLGPLIGKIGSLFTSKNTAEVKAYNVEIGKVWTTLHGTYGTLDELEAKAQAVGLSFKDNIGHQGKAGLEAMNTLAQEFKRRWDDINNTLATSRTELDGLIKQGADLGYTFDASGKLVSVSTEKMREVAGKFGLDLKALGPSFDQAGLRTRMEDVINGFTLMDKGGTSTGTILAGMKDEINAIVNDSRKLGVDIPANMQPWIANLIETGQLTDANGVKITDLAAIQFGAPMATQFDTISTQIGAMIAKIGELVDRLATALTPAIDNATRDRTINIGFSVDDIPDIDFSGRDGGERSRGFARGTFGTLGHDFPDFGSGTRTVLHGREAVVPREDMVPTAMRWMAAAGLAGSMVAPSQASAAPVNVYIVGDTSREARIVSEAEFRQIQDRLNGGGLTIPVRAISQRGR